MTAKSARESIRDQLASLSPAMRTLFDGLRQYADSPQAEALRARLKRPDGPPAQLLKLDASQLLRWPQFDPNLGPWGPWLKPDLEYLRPIEPALAKPKSNAGRRAYADDALVEEGVAALRGGKCRSALAAARAIVDGLPRELLRGAIPDSAVRRLQRKISAAFR